MRLSLEAGGASCTRASCRIRVLLGTAQQGIFVSENLRQSDRPAVRQEFIFVKRRSSLVALRSFGRCFVAYRLSSHS